MKNIKYKLLSMIIILSFLSCSESDTVIDDVYDNVDTTSGVILRLLNFDEIPDIISSTNDNFSDLIELNLEVQQGNGSFIPDIKELRFYVLLAHDSDFLELVEDPNGNLISELLFSTIGEDEFEIGENDLPVVFTEIPVSSIVNSLPENTELPVPTFISIRLEIEMADGEIFSADNISTAINGPYFRSTFQYTFILLNN